MKNIGIIFAMKEELQALKKYLTVNKIERIYELTFYEALIANQKVILVESGVGKVNAARTAQILIDNYHPSVIYNIGVAGGIASDLTVGDIVISTSLIQHDFDITAFGHDKGYITGVGDYISSDSQLIGKIKNSINNISNEEYKIKVGIIASGDIFCTAVEMKDKIYAKFNADCVEMEGAAIAQVCYLDKIPFIIIRSISDSPNGKNAIVFDEFVKLAAKRCSDILLEFLK